MMTDIDFAALVRLIRRARKQTQEELARDLDVTVGTMNGWENGKHRPVKAQRRRLVTMAEEMGLNVPGDRSQSRRRKVSKIMDGAIPANGSFTRARILGEP